MILKASLKNIVCQNPEKRTGQDMNSLSKKPQTETCQHPSHNGGKNGLQSKVLKYRNSTVIFKRPQHTRKSEMKVTRLEEFNI
jgi:hypothetical protein